MGDLLLLLFLLILSSFFSGTEIALFSLTREKLLVEKQTSTGSRSKWIERLEVLSGQPHQTLVLILLCNNVVNILASSIATVVALRFAQTSGIGLSESAVLAIVTGIMTFLILLFGEITPKALAHKYALQFSLFSVKVLWFLRMGLSWIVFPLAAVTEKIVGKQEQAALTEEEIKAAVTLTEQLGDIDEEERQLVQKVLEFDDYRVDSVMTARSKVFSLPSDMTLAEAMETIIIHKYSRIPIYLDQADNVIGVLTIHQIVEALIKKEEQKVLGSLISADPIKVPPSMHINEVMQVFQTEKTSHMAFVMSADGQMLGLVTMEDILEEIFGEIHDETDAERHLIHDIGNGTFECQAEIELEKVEDGLRETFPELQEIDTPWDRKMENKSLRHYLIEEWRHFPELNETLEKETTGWKFLFTASEVEDQNLTKVLIQITQKNQ